MKKSYLFTPGPTSVPPEALKEMSRPIFHHRTTRYRKMFENITNSLKKLFRTENDVLTFTSSGSGAMEASVVNLLSFGDKVITVNGGKFGERWGDICRIYGVEVIEIKTEWGAPVNPCQVEEILKQGCNNEIQAVFVTLSETSTGVVNDVKSIAKIVAKTSAVLVVDAISGLGADDIRTDDWHVDVLITGSQKGLMIPPGLAFASVSEKAWGKIAESSLPKFYFDMEKARKSLISFDTPYTPATSLIRGLKVVLDMIHDEGVDNVIARHAKYAKASRAAVKAMGLELFAPDSPSNAVTAVKVPEGIDGDSLIKHLLDEYGIQVAGGQAHLKGKIIRFAHLGYYDRLDVIMVLSGIEMALKDIGYDISLGCGIKAAEELLVG